MSTQENREQKISWVEKLTNKLKNVDFNILAKYVAIYTNETIGSILAELNQVIARDSSKKEEWKVIKDEILDLVRQNKNTLDYSKLQHTSLQGKQLPINNVILNRLQEVMKKKQEQEQEQEQKKPENNPGQKI
jgi:hypothetical protein